MKREAQITERAALYQEMIVQAVEARASAAGPMPNLDMLLLTMVDRLEALLWVLLMNS